jgi:uncharacterized protein YabE (DUF348 family)
VKLNIFLDKRLKLGAFSAPLWAALGVLAVLLIVAVGAAVALPASRPSTVEQRGRLVTIYDDTNKKIILSTAETIRDVLGQAEIEVDPADIVEPSLDSQLVASSYSVNIYRSRPVVVVDGGVEKRVITAAQSGRTIAQDAGIDLYYEDETTTHRDDDVLGDDGAIMRVTVVRSLPVRLVLYGQTMSMRTQAKTVGEFLDEKDLKINDGDFMSPGRDVAISPDMEIRIWREGRNVVTLDEEIDFSVQKIQSNDHDVGYRAVQTEGVKGLRNVTYEVVMHDGVEFSRTELQSVVLREPVAQVEVVGIRYSLPAGSHQDWMRTAGIAEADFGYVEYIISHESGWGVTKSNYAGSGAYGLCQALPGSKMSSAGADWATNPITQLRWCNGYAVGRYGSWKGAYEFWISRHWW